MAFALMADPITDDESALRDLLTFMERGDPCLLLTRDGPQCFALLQHFGLVQPYQGQERMDALDAELVCRLLVAFEKWKITVHELENAGEFIVRYDAEYLPN